MPRFGQVRATDVWAAATRTLSGFAAQDLFDLGGFDDLYVAPLVTSSATPDTFGSWVQLVADVGAAKRLIYVILHNTNGATRVIPGQVQIGEGAAGAEASILSISFNQPAGHGLLVPVFRSLTNNARLSARFKQQQAAANDVYATPIIA